MRDLCFLTATCVVVLFGPTLARADDEAQLRKQIADLKAENSALKDSVIKLQKELADEKAKAKPAAPQQAAKAAPKADAFAVGAKFAGNRNMGPKIKHNMTLEITKRNGTGFVGTMTLTNPDTGAEVTSREVKGTAPAEKGAVKFAFEKVDKYQQSYAGELAKGEIIFRFGGTAVDGKPATGDGVLKAQ